MTSQVLEKRFNELIDQIEASQVKVNWTEIKIQAIKQMEKCYSVGPVTVNGNVSYAKVQIDYEIHIDETYMVIAQEMSGWADRPFAVAVTQNEIPVFTTTIWGESSGEEEAIDKAIRRFMMAGDVQTEELSELEKRLDELKEQINDSRIEADGIERKIDTACNMMAGCVIGPVHRIEEGSTTSYSRVHIGVKKYIITIYELPRPFYLGIVATDGIPVFVHKFQPKDWNKTEVVNDVVREFVIYSINADEDEFTS